MTTQRKGLRVYLMTIEDGANFDKLEHRSVFADEQRAWEVSRDIVRVLIERDRHYGLGDTFCVTVTEFPLQA